MLNNITILSTAPFISDFVILPMCNDSFNFVSMAAAFMTSKVSIYSSPVVASHFLTFGSWPPFMFLRVIDSGIVNC